jgi:hypothetical protein
VLGPAAKWRAQIVPATEAVPEEPVAAPPSTAATEPLPAGSNADCEENPVAEETGKKKRSGRKNYSWAELIQRVFAADVTVCGICGGRLRLISPIPPPVATRKILDHLGLPSRPPPLTPAARSTDSILRFDDA